MTVVDWDSVRASLSDTGLRVSGAMQPKSVAGGDISAAWKWSGPDGKVFIKTGDANAYAMFDAEADGLRELARCGAIRVPAVLASIRYENGACLALEWLDLRATDRHVERRLGRELAAMHRCTQTHHGWTRSNTIGLTPQINDECADWLEFYREQRLRFQLRLASQNGYGGELQTLGERLCGRLEFFFEEQAPPPSLLHGDLWGGNWACCNGAPVIFDPAVYYGDRETDIAMTRLFGGFGSDFYAAYSECWPMAQGHERRTGLYQLYHVLNHLNLFGRGYLGRAVSLMQQLLR